VSESQELALEQLSFKTVRLQLANFFAQFASAEDT